MIILYKWKMVEISGWKFVKTIKNKTSEKICVFTKKIDE